MKLGSIFEQIAEACLVVDNSGRVIFINDSAARLLACGRSLAAETPSTPAKEFFGQPLPEDSSGGLPIRQTCETVISTRQSLRIHHFARGLQQWFELRASPAADAVVLFCFESAAAPDESTAVLEQRINRQSMELAEATRELESVSYTVSHDLRAPLRHIEAFGCLLQQNLGQIAPADEVSPSKLPGTAAPSPSLESSSTAEYIGIISESAKQMSVLLDGVLAYSRLCRREVNRTTVSLDQALKAVLQELKVQTEGRQIEWHIDPLPEVEADPWMVRQCLSQLISNALKFTRSRPTATIHVSSFSTPEDIVVRIADNGLGFDLQYSERLFGLFQKLRSDPQFEGAGLGLAHARRMMLRQGGRIWAESKPDSGATFFLAFPRVN